VQQLIESDPDVEIIWRAFELRPEPVPMIDPNSDYLKRAWSDSVAPLAAQLGVTMRFPPVKPRTRLAHEAAYWARQQGRFDNYHEELFRAFFERGEDIGEIDVLVELALNLKLDGDSLRQSMISHEFAPSVMADELAAAPMGVSGVPAFIANRKAALSGVQPVENLMKLIQSVRDASS
jgi:predicted DsbA family dithiol-disulfide isomerase